MAKEKQTDAFKTMGALFEPLINALSKDAEVRESIINLIGREGPPHKQWQHTLVLSRLQVLLQQTAKATGKKFKPVKGTPITITDPKHEEGETFPLSFPPQSFSFIGQEANMQEKLSKGPQHEAVYAAILLQAIEWLISLSDEDV